jgi:RimJ/RimL family protein N-acetyltransferase
MTDTVVYIVDRDQNESRALAALLSAYDIQVRYCPDAKSLLALMPPPSNESGWIITEFDLPGQDGLSFVKEMSLLEQCPPVTVVGTGVEVSAQQQIRSYDFAEFIDRSLAMAYLLQRVSSLVPGMNELPQTVPSVLKLNDGREVTLRITHPDDAEMQQSFIVGLSDRSRYLRFFSWINKLPPSVLKKFTHPDYPYSYAVIATVQEDDDDRQIGVARYAPTGTMGVAEFAVAIADKFHGQGIATQLMRLLMLAAGVGGIHRLEGVILRENKNMLALASKLGFTFCPDYDADPSVVLYVRDLRKTPAG